MDRAIELSREICALSNPDKIILFGHKSDINSENIRDISLCVIVDTMDKEALECSIYMSVDLDVAFNLLIYTPDEWEMLTYDPQSYAFRIVSKGSVIYERKV
jgi:predicted nucleotidyltransferase